MIKTIVIKTDGKKKMQRELDEALTGIGKEELIDIKLAGAGDEGFMAIIIYEENFLK